MKNRKNQNKCYWLLVCYLFLFNISTAAEALATNPKLNQNTFTLEVTGNLITLKAEQASLTDILRDLENKTGIKVKLFPGVDDKRVTLIISDLPVYEVHTFLEKMGVENFAVVYDNKLSSKVIYILPVGEDVTKFEDDVNINLLPKIVDYNIARRVAEDYLPKYYPGDWVYFDKLIFYDLDGQPAAYAFIFRKPDSNTTTLQELEESMSKARSERDSLADKISRINQSESISEDEKRNEHRRLKALLNHENEKLYKWKSFATLITGSTEVSSLELSHYKGLPPVFVRKFDLQKHLDTNYPNKNLTLGKIIFFDPFDIRYEVQINSETIYLIDLRKKKLEKISTIKDSIAKAQLRDKRRRDLMKPKERVRYDKGIQDRNKTNSSQWDNYKISK